MARSKARSKSPALKLSKKKKGKQTDEDWADYKELFEEIDSDDSGGIDALELQHAMVTVFGVKVTTAQVHQMMKTADVNGDGVVDLAEFTMLMKGIAIDSVERKGTEKDALGDWMQASGIAAADQTLAAISEVIEPLHAAVLKHTPAENVKFGFHKEQSLVVHYASGMTRFYADYVLSVVLIGMAWGAKQGVNALINFLLAQVQMQEISQLSEEAISTRIAHLLLFMMLVISFHPMAILLKLSTRSQTFGGFLCGCQVMTSDHLPCGQLIFITRTVVSFFLVCSIVGGLVDVIFMILSPRGISLTDLLMGTHVVVIPVRTADRY